MSAGGKRGREGKGSAPAPAAAAAAAASMDVDLEEVPAAGRVGAEAGSATASAAGPSSTPLQKKRKIDVAASSPAQSMLSAMNAAPASNGSSSMRIRHVLERLYAWMTQEEHPIDLGVFASSLQSELDGLPGGPVSEASVIGFLANSSTGKSFLLNLLFFLTCSDARAYGSSKFRSKAYELEYKADAPRNAAAAAQVVRLADRLQAEGAALQAGLALEASRNRELLDDVVSSAYLQRRQFSMFEGEAAWLLPSQAGVAATTTVPVRIRYGRTFHLVLRFLSTKELCDKAFEAVYKIRAGEHPTLADDSHYVALRHPSLPERPRQVAADAALQLHPEVLALAGKMQVFEGVGAQGKLDASVATFDMDRCWLRRQLVLLNADKQRSACVSSVDVFVPSSVLARGCHIIDIPGCGDEEHAVIMRQEVGKCDLLFLLSQQGLCTATTVADSLLETGFITNMLRRASTRHQLHIINYMEKSNGHRVWGSSAAREQRLKDVESFKQNTMQWLERVLEDLEANAVADRDTLMARVEQCIRIYAVDPVSFASLAASRRRRATQQLSEPAAAALPGSAAALSSAAPVAGAAASPGSFPASVDDVPALLDQTGFPDLLAAILSLERVNAVHVLNSILPRQGAAAAHGAAAAGGAGATSLLPRLRQACETELRALQSLRTPEAHRALSELAASAHSAAALKQRLETAAVEVKLDTERMRWQQHFREVCEAHPWANSLRIADALAAAQLELQRAASSRDFKLDNVHSSLHPKYKGTRYLHIRRALFRYFEQHPLDWDTILATLRASIEAFMRKRVRELLEQVLDQLTHKNLRGVALIEAAKERALSSLDARVLSAVDRIFSGPLSADKVPVEFDRHAFLVSLCDWLGGNYDRWRGKTLAQVREGLRAAPEAVLQATPAAFCERLVSLLDKRSLQPFWDLLNYQGRRSALVHVVLTFFAEVGRRSEEQPGPGPGGDGERAAQLREMTRFLDEWKEEAQEVQKAEQGGMESYLAGLKSDAMQAVAEKWFLSDALQSLSAVLSQGMRGVLRARDHLRGAGQPHSYRVLHSHFFKEFVPAHSESSKRVQELLRHVVQLKAQPPREDVDLQAATLSQRLGLTGTPHVAERGAQWTHMQTQLRTAWGLELADTPGDGDCLYTALAHQLRWAPTAANGEGEIAVTPEFLRELAAEQVHLRFRDDAVSFQALVGETPLAYYERQRQAGVWSGELELQALADVLDLQIAVWLPSGRLDRPMLFRPRAKLDARVNPTSLPTVHLAMLSTQGALHAEPNHFVSLVELPPHQRRGVAINTGANRTRIIPSREELARASPSSAGGGANAAAAAAARGAAAAPASTHGASSPRSILKKK